MACKTINLNTNWRFKEAGSDDQLLLPVSQFPTNIHLDLLHHGKIADPFLDKNEDKVQWVGERKWTYTCWFEKPQGEYKNALLVFTGLDTHASIYLNGNLLLSTENMYLEYPVRVENELREQNELTITFDSTFLIGKKLEKEWTNGGKFLFWNGDSSRLATRKAPCHYGWDWGPTLLTCGPWRPVLLKCFDAAVKEVDLLPLVTDDLTQGKVDVCAFVGGQASSATFVLYGPDGQVVTQTSGPVVHGCCQKTLSVQNPSLWYPVRYGAQPRHRLEVKILDGDIVLDTYTKRFGFRHLRLVQKPIQGQKGTTFFFQVNNIPIYCAGSDWIPADTFLPRLNEEKYRAWIELAVRGNQNMIRVWGGGIYEDDVFYDICDELGVLVWQDFMLACGNYPVKRSFLEHIESEAIFHVKRLRHHPCLSLWCGNNEDHMFAEWHKLEYNPSETDPEQWLKTNWPARYIYDKLLKDVCEKHSSAIPYHPGSPWGGPFSNSPDAGDMHSWKVWMADLDQFPYQDYPKLGGRFISEFGMKSYPCMKTIEHFITDPKERYPQSLTMDKHQMAPGDQRSIALYLVDNLRHGMEMNQYVYATQLLQAESTSYAMRSWRRSWRGPGREECGGALVWQLNDCWSAVSWSLIDYQYRPKLAYYVMKRDIAPISVGISRHEEEDKDDEFTRVNIRRRTRTEVWASNFWLEQKPMTLRVEAFDFSNGKCLWSPDELVTLESNRTTELISRKWVHETAAVVSARLIEHGRTVARLVDWPQPLKHLDFAGRDVDVRVEGEFVHVSSSLPIKGLAFSSADDAVKFEDNCLDLVPGDEQTFKASGLKDRKIDYMHLQTCA